MGDPAPHPVDFRILLRFDVRFFAVLLFSLASLVPLVPRPATAQAVPEPLRPWMPWVVDAESHRPCYRTDQGHACTWMNRLHVDVAPQAVRFTLETVTDRPQLVAIPGDAQVWPAKVEANGRPARMARRVDGGPAVRLAAGSWTIRGIFAPSGELDTLTVPRQVAVLSLAHAGRRHPAPRTSSDGRLSLRPPSKDAAEVEGIRVETYRRLRDGVPLEVTTVLRVQVFGRARTVRLGRALLENTVVTRIASRWPTTVDDEGVVDVHVQPGSQEIRIDGLLPNPQTELAVPRLSAGMTVAPEIWVWVANPSLRSVEVSGLSPLDPTGASLPQGWDDGLVLTGAAQDTLRLEEVLRGQTAAAPNQLKLNRNIWLDFDGRGFTVVDRIAGRLNQQWRLDYGSEGALGRVTRMSDQRDLTVSEKTDGQRGVELRQANLDVQAVIRHDTALSRLRIVGWDHDVQELTVELNAPPGWSLIATQGVDMPEGTWLASWSLIELVFIVLLAWGAGQLFGPLTAVVAFVAFVLSHPSGSTLFFWWTNLLIAIALSRRLTSPTWSRLMFLYRVAVIIALGSGLATFVEKSVRAAVHPQTAAAPAPNAAAQILTSASKRPASQPVYRGVSKPLSYEGKVATVVQTGPGLQNWSWQRWSLAWVDPVRSDHEVTLYWLSPLWSRIVHLSAAIMGLVLFLMLLPWRGKTTFGTAVVVASGLTFGPSAAMAGEIPSPKLLDELKRRLEEQSKCQGPCLITPEMNLRLGPQRAQLTAVVDAQQNATFRVPGPSSVLRVTEVKIDNKKTQRLLRTDDGHVLVGVPAGRHRLDIDARLSDEPTLTLRLDHASKPQSLNATGDGWRIEGLVPGRVPNDVLRLVRTTKRQAEAPARPTSPGGWTWVERAVNIHVPWTVRTTVRRDHAVGADVMRIPLHRDEKMVSEGIRVQDGVAIVELAPSVTVATFDTTLPISDRLELVARGGPPDASVLNGANPSADGTSADNGTTAAAAWTETWRVYCSPLWTCRFEGLPPHRTVDGDEIYHPTWKPWPGERLIIRAERPAVAQGATITIDDVTYELRPGRRLLSASLDLDILSSRGGWHALRLPPDIDIRRLTIDGHPFSARPKDGVLNLPLGLGRTKMNVAWQQPWSPATRQTAPPIDLGAEAANVHVRIMREGRRWLLWPFGPRWGPSALFWVRTGLLIAAALLLSLTVRTPLAGWELAIVAFGLGHLPASVLLAAFVALVLLQYRRDHPPEGPVMFNAAQLASSVAAAGLALVLAVGLMAALLLPVNMMVRGVASTNTRLEWFLDRVESTALPEVGFVSIPMAAWQALMVLFVLFVAARIRPWGRWVYDTLKSEGVWLRPMPPPPKPPSTPDPSPPTD